MRQQSAWPSGFRACASFTFDVDGESAVLGADWEARRRPSVMSHQAYGPEVGVPRILDILRRHSVRGTFFIPGLVAEWHPEMMAKVLDQGHEIAHHGYLHRSPSELDEAGETEELDRGLEALAKYGVTPRGYRAPMWDLSDRTLGMVSARGLRYDSSLMNADAPYLVSWPNGGAGEVLAEIAISWGLDDWEQYGYVPGLSSVVPISGPGPVLQMWRDEMEAVLEDGGHFVLTCHPFLSGRPSRSRIVEALVAQAVSTDGVWVATLEEVAEHVHAVGSPVRQVGWS